MYLLVAYMALRLGRTEDAGGALDYLRSGAGRVLLAAMAAGFAGYSAWRLVDAAFDVEDRKPGWRGAFSRIGGAGSGLVHGGLAWKAAKAALGGHSGGGSNAEYGAATVMSLPGGNTLLLGAAAVLAIVAGVQLSVGLRRRFLRHLSAEAGRHGWVPVVGMLGYVSRGVIFGVAAWLLVHAALHHSPAEAGGLGDSLRSLPELLLTAVAAGLALFGIFSLVEAWYRVMRPPRVKQRVESALAG